MIKDSPEGKIGIYTRFIEFANFRVPLSRFLLRVLKYYQINFSQLSILGAAKDPIPFGNHVNTELLNFLDHHRTVIRRYPEVFLCLIGLSRSFDDPQVYPTLLKDDRSDMGLLDFVKSADPFKVNTGERTLAEGEVPLNDETVNMAVDPSAEIIWLKLRTDEVVISEPVPATTAGKSPAALKRLVLQSSAQGDATGSASHPAEEFVSSSVTLTPKTVVHGDSALTQDETVQGRLVSSKLVVTSNSERDEVNASPKVGSFVPHTALDNVDADLTDRVGTSSAPESDAGPSTSVPEEGSPIDEFYESQTIDSATAQDIYIRSRERFQKNFTSSSAVVQQRDAEIVALKARLELAEKDATDVVLRGRVFELETGTAAKSD
nr:hypothetical protein [Tanacetum cinerariifolium]